MLRTLHKQHIQPADQRGGISPGQSLPDGGTPGTGTLDRRTEEQHHRKQGEYSTLGFPTGEITGKIQDSPKSSFQADSINLFLNFDIPAEQMSGNIRYNLEDILVISRQDNFVSNTSANLTDLLETGYNALGSYSVGVGSIEFDFSSPELSLIHI